MARRKKHHKKHTTRRRRVSGFGSGLGHEAMEAVGLVAGGVASVVIQKQISSVNPKIAAGGTLVAGVLIKKHSKSPFMTGFGYGMMATGAVGLAHDFHLIAGVEEFVSGLTNSQFVSSEREGMRGIDNESHLTGFPNSPYSVGAYDYSEMGAVG